MMGLMPEVMAWHGQFSEPHSSVQKNLAALPAPSTSAQRSGHFFQCPVEEVIWQLMIHGENPVGDTIENVSGAGVVP